MKVDLLTPSEAPSDAAKIERGKYARICVELDLPKRLVSRVIAANTAYCVEYEGLNLICFECGRYGHRKDNCQWVHPQQASMHETGNSPPVVTKSTPAASSQIIREQRTHNLKVDEPFGPWMIVSRGNKNRPARRVGISEVGKEKSLNSRLGKPAGNSSNTSRFQILAEIEEEERLGKSDNKRKEWVPVRARSEHVTYASESKFQLTRPSSMPTDDRNGKEMRNSSVRTKLVPKIRKEKGGHALNEDLTLEAVTQVGGAECTVKGKETREHLVKKVQVGHNEKQQTLNLGHGEKRMTLKLGSNSRRNGDMRGTNGKENMQDLAENGPSKNFVGRRTHQVVRGNINQAGPSQILPQNEEEGLRINGVLLLEGPEQKQDPLPDAFMKENFEVSEGNQMDIFTDLEEDVGDDFNFMEVQHQGSQELIEQEFQSQDNLMIE